MALALPGACQERDAAGLAVVSKSITSAEAVQIALANNPTLTARKAAVAAFAARANAAGSMTKLQLSTTTFLTRADDLMIVPSSPGVEPANARMVPATARASQSLMLMYPLFTGGRLRWADLAARSEADAASAEAAAAELDVALATRIAYDRAALAASYVEVYRRLVEESAERVRVAEAAYREGRVASYDVLRNRTALAEARQQLTNAERDAALAAIDLKHLLGVSQESTIELSDKLEDNNEPAKPSQGNGGGSPAAAAISFTEALAGRPEIKAAESVVAAAQAKLRAAKAAYLPQVYAVAMQELSAARDDIFRRGSLIGISASLPILDGGARSSAVSEAQAALEEARAAQRDLALAVARDLAAASAELAAASKNVATAQAALDQAEEDYRVVRLRYEAGKGINVEVLDALTSLTRARTNLADALYQQRIAGHRLARSIGRK